MYDSNLFSLPSPRQADLITRITPGIDSEYLHGIAKLPERLVILLDVDRVLARDERRALEVA